MIRKIHSSKYIIFFKHPKRKKEERPSKKLKIYIIKFEDPFKYYKLGIEWFQIFQIDPFHSSFYPTHYRLYKRKKKCKEGDEEDEVCSPKTENSL
jgi:hypothetical protein